jgi:hypothetical protein
MKAEDAGRYGIAPNGSPSPLNGERVRVRGVNAIGASFKMVSTEQDGF